MKKRCPQCGQIYTGEVTFCQNDGADLVTVETSPHMAVPVESGTRPRTNAGSQPTPLGAIAVGITLLFGVGMFISGGQSRQQAAEERRLAEQARVAAESAANKAEAERAQVEELRATVQNTVDSESTQTSGDSQPEPADAVNTPTNAESIGAALNYTDDTLGFRLNYPVGWKKSVQRYDDGRTRVRFDTLEANVYFLVDVSPLEVGMDSPRGIWSGMDKRYGKAFKERYRLISLDDRNLDGRSASRWEFVLQKKGEMPLHKVDRGIISGGYHYALLFAALPERFGAYQSTFDEA